MEKSSPNKVALAGIFMGFTFLLLWTNLYIAERIAPKLRPEGPEEALVNRYHETLDPVRVSYA